MAELHIIVYHRDGSWQFTCRGTVTAPYNSREMAIEAAIAEARQMDDPRVEVIVQGKDLTQETVWRAGQG